MQSTDKKRLVENRYKNVPRAVNPGGRLRLRGRELLERAADPARAIAGAVRGAHARRARRARGARRRLLEDEADAGLAPVAVLANHGGLDIVPGIAIGCDGDVRSVVLVGERPIEELDEVLLDASSRTSVVLARLVLKHLRGGSEPRYCSKPPNRSRPKSRAARARS